MQLLKRSTGLLFTRFSASYSIKSSNLLPNLIHHQRYLSTKQNEQEKSQESDNEIESETEEEREKKDVLWDSLSEFEKEIFIKRKMKETLDTIKLPNVSVVDFNNFLKDLGVGKKYKTLRKTFEAMKTQIEPNEETYKIVFKYLGSAASKDLTNLVNIFDTLKKQFSYQPTVKDYEILLLSFINDPVNFKKYFEEFQQSGLPRTSRLYNILIFFYGRKDNRQKVEELFEEVKNSQEVSLNTAIYNSMIRYYGETGNWEKVDEFYAILKKGARGIKPNTKTFNTLLLVYGQDGNAEAMKRTMEELLAQKGVPPNKETEEIYIRYRAVLNSLPKENPSTDKQ